MNALVVFENFAGLQWIVVRELFVQQAKAGLRSHGTPAIAVIRPKRRSLSTEYDDD